MTSSARLQDKVAIVTGSSSGIGRAISLRYAREGAKLVCGDLTPTARSEDEATITTHDSIVQAGGQAIFVQTDVGDAKAMENLVAAAVALYGRLDVLVNNAGIGIESHTPAVLHLTDEANWDATMRVNTKSIFLGCKYALTQMLAQEPHSSGDRGWIINISSILGIGAVSSLTRQAALDYAGHNIHVNALCPGYTHTALLADAHQHLTSMDDLSQLHPLKGLGMPEDVARMAVVLASDDASWVTGVCVPVDGGYTAR
ncbi:uncharacterized protein N7506_003448 [Penicillium brevicompactum]|uniref:uncharacterized protein n=1 Tax=Penicillium brevicompactum TaxID=5074 RepID=UPI002541B432|nr:uncharacterized protein N7506_003448 [Penicillium brevicompactum]KAJ5343624.1 hypothetical protein N7506_003448 [Penicillium brevicompactum]